MHGGTGWEAVVLKARTRAGVAQLQLRLVERTAKGAAYEPIWLMRSAVRALT